MKTLELDRESPILFSGEMVRAILEGRKTQTRRIVKPLCGCPDFYTYKPDEPYPYYFRRKDAMWDSFKTLKELTAKYCRYDRPFLWVKETFREALSETHQCYAYRADMHYQCGKEVLVPDCGILAWRPSIFMPRKASRILLKVESVGIERIQDITAKDCIAEGIQIERNINTACGKAEAFNKFILLWDSINEKRGYGFDSNPLVWVIKFEKCS